jgi:hypothetical protein
VPFPQGEVGLRLNSANLLRVAAVIQLLLFAGHSLGGLSKWSPVADNSVLSAMEKFQMPVVGVTRSYLDFYIGFGWIISVAMLSQAALMWVTASIPNMNSRSLRIFIAIYAGWSLPTAILAWTLIFPVPAVMATAVFLTLAAALRRSP